MELFHAKFAAASGVGTSFIGLFVVISASFATIEYYNKNGENNDILGPVILSVACFFLVVPAQTVKTFIEGKDPGAFTGVPTDFLGPKGVYCSTYNCNCYCGIISFLCS